MLKFTKLAPWLVVMYICYVIAMVIAAGSRWQSMEQEANSFADLNHDGAIQVTELLEVYRTLNLNGQNILDHMPKNRKLDYLSRAWQGREVDYIKLLLGFWDETGEDTGARVNLNCVIVHIADTDKDGKISDDEAAAAFYTAYGATKSGQGGDSIASLNLDSTMVDPRSYFKYFVCAFWAKMDTEIYRYVRIRRSSS